MSRPITPLVVIDVIIEVTGGIVLIERNCEPLGWALPGGLIDLGETTADAAKREAKEETGLDITNVRFLGFYDRPDRDPRGPAISFVYVCTANGTPVAGDDAKGSKIVDPRNIAELCFDHNDIIQDYLNNDSSSS